MPVDCQRGSSGGKGNINMFIERDPKICAAGLPSQQPDDKVSDSLQHYLMKDEVDALISDAIIPPPLPRPLPPLRRPQRPDKRNAIYGDVSEIINPPIKTKFQTLVEDLKDTAFESYWKKPLGRVKDPAPMLPEGLDTINTTFGKKTAFHGRLYDIVMPKIPYPDKTPRSKWPGVQTDRHYCKPPFRPDVIYGHVTGVDKRGIYAKCALTYDSILDGTGNRSVVSSIQADYQDFHTPRLATVLAPYDNISNVPPRHCFGKLKKPDNLPECLTYCNLNPDNEKFRRCLAHLNSLRKVLSKRFLPNFFNMFYLNLKYFDKQKCGWLPKNVVYDYCASKLIRFDPQLIEHLLTMWHAFDGSMIEYKKFVHVLNYREPSPELPKVPDVDEKCLDFRTTYSEMVKPGQEIDCSLMAGLPSGRYFDMDYPVTPEGCCKAARACLPHESDMKSCLNPSILTLLNVNHRDMYAKREPQIVRGVFEATGIKFTDEKFNELWAEAQKLHSQGWVCYETFRKVLEENPPMDENMVTKEVKETLQL